MHNAHELLQCDFYEEFLRPCEKENMKATIPSLTLCGNCAFFLNKNCNIININILIFYKSILFRGPHYSQIILKIINVKFLAEPHRCPGDLEYKDNDVAFPPSCSNSKPQTEFKTRTCLPKAGVYFF